MGNLRGMYLTLDEKVELERIYKEYCNNDLGVIREEDKFANMMSVFVEFRLEVSGGREYNSSVGCRSVEGFLNEICLFDDMMCDWGGAYRGDFCWECFDGLNEILDNSTLEEDIKNEIIEGFKEIYGMNEE
jgi:hypothetical protein